MVIQIADDFYLFLYDLRKHPIFNRKQAGNLRDVLLLYPGLDAHPQGHASDDLQCNTSQTPNIDDPRILIFLHLLQHFFIVIHLVLIEDVVQDLRRHVLRGCH